LLPTKETFKSVNGNTPLHLSLVNAEEILLSNKSKDKLHNSELYFR